MEMAACYIMWRCEECENVGKLLILGFGDFGNGGMQYKCNRKITTFRNRKIKIKLPPFPSYLTVVYR
jgi:hypothetical protein